MIALLTVEQAAEYLGRSRDWLMQAARRGDIPGCKVGKQWRFRETDITAYLDSVRTGSASARVTRRRRAS